MVKIREFDFKPCLVHDEARNAVCVTLPETFPLALLGESMEEALHFEDIEVIILDVRQVKEHRHADIAGYLPVLISRLCYYDKVLDIVASNGPYPSIYAPVVRGQTWANMLTMESAIISAEETLRLKNDWPLK